MIMKKEKMKIISLKLVRYYLIHIIISTMSSPKSYKSSNSTGSRRSRGSRNSNESEEMILNKRNVFITKKNVEDMLLQAGIKEKINDLSLWQQAFVHTSYTCTEKNKQLSSEYKFNRSVKPIGGEDTISESKVSDFTTSFGSDETDVMPLQPKSNEGLEWYGDKQVGKAVAEYLDERYPEQDEGFYTDTCSKLVQTKSLAKFARFLKFEKYIVISRYDDEYCKARERDDCLENTFEAFVGAMHKYFKARYSRARADEVIYLFVITIIEKRVNMAELILTDENYKKQLMIHYQRNFEGKFPVYGLHDSDMKSAGSTGVRIFHAYVYCPFKKEIWGEGFGPKKREAEQDAAKNAMIRLGLLQVKKKRKVVKLNKLKRKTESGSV